MNIHNALLFEQTVSKIFNESGYSIERNVNLNCTFGDIDIIAKKDSKTYCVEVKYSPIINKAAGKICSIANEAKMHPILVTAYYIDPKRKKQINKDYPDLELVDIANLLYATQYNIELQNELVAELPYSVEGIEPEYSFLQSNVLQHADYTVSLIEEMESCEAGRDQARSYEELCYKLLENIFSEDLALWREQEKSNKNLYRFDLLCRIKDGNQKTFWSILERYFNSKYVIFEFKNYKDLVSQKEIYTTEKYLYAKALRCVAILVSANGYNENAYWAAKGCLRENGKLIILLSTKDLIAMNKMKIDHEDPSNYLLEKLDTILLELEK